MKLIKPILKRWSTLKLSMSTCLGILLGWAIYTFLVAKSYSSLESAIIEAPVFQSLFKDDPAMLGMMETFETKESQDIYKKMIADNRIRVLSWRLLMDMGVLESDKSASDVGSYISDGVITPFLKSPRGELIGTSGVRIFCQMMKNLGGDDSDPNIGKLEVIVSKVLANSPEAYDLYVEGINRRQTSEQSLNSKGFFGRIFAYAMPKEIAPCLWGESAGINDLIGALMSHLHVNDKFTELDLPGTTTMQPIQEEKRQVEEFARRILIEINNNQEVAKARDWVLVYQGPMQLLMLITFFICLSLLLTKFSNRVLKSEDDLTEKEIIGRNRRKKTRKWMFSVLPLFGFIGTILGLMQALGDAYKIPLAQGGSSTAIAISEITGKLGIAFTTTLMAFSMTIVLGFFELVVEQYDVSKMKSTL